MIALLRKIKVPALFMELMGLVYRFIFVMAETAEKIYTSQSSRLGYVNLNRGYHSLGQLVSNLFIKSYHRSKMLFIALTSRCYTGEIAVLEKSYRLSPGNIAIILLLDTGLVLFGIWERWGGPAA
jgi:ABC-type cobalt transport system, permease component CbiQ and related transporters